MWCQAPQMRLKLLNWGSDMSRILFPWPSRCLFYSTLIFYLLGFYFVLNQQSKYNAHRATTRQRRSTTNRFLESLCILTSVITFPDLTRPSLPCSKEKHFPSITSVKIALTYSIKNGWIIDFTFKQRFCIENIWILFVIMLNMTICLVILYPKTSRDHPTLDNLQAWTSLLEVFLTRI